MLSLVSFVKLIFPAHQHHLLEQFKSLLTSVSDSNSLLDTDLVLNVVELLVSYKKA